MNFQEKMEAARAGKVVSPAIGSRARSPQSVQGRRVKSADLVKTPGDFYFDGNDLHIFAPNQPHAINLPTFKGKPEVAGAPVRGWEISGTEDKPTLRPSINITGETRWHGFLTAGDFICCGEAAKDAPSVAQRAAAAVLSAPLAMQPLKHGAHPEYDPGHAKPLPGY